MVAVKEVRVSRRTPPQTLFPLHFVSDFSPTLLFPRCVYQPASFISTWRLRGAWPARFFIFQPSCTVSPADNGALHQLLHAPLRVGAVPPHIQSGSANPTLPTTTPFPVPRHYWQNNSLKKPSWPKRREVAYRRRRLTSICDEINQFGPRLSLFLSFSSHSPPHRHHPLSVSRHPVDEERRLFE